MLVELRKVGMFEVTQNGIRFHFRDIGVDAGISAWQKGIPQWADLPLGLARKGSWPPDRAIPGFRCRAHNTARTPNWDGWVEGAQAEHHHGTRVLWNVRVHGVNKADVIHVLSGLRKDVTHPLATPAILKPKGEGIVRFGIPKRLSIDDFRPLTGMLGKKWFVIKGVHLGRASRHK